MGLAENSKVRFNYELLETYEAGLELLGFEVKSLKIGRGELAGARVLIRGGEAFLVGATIPPYQAGNTPEDYDSARTRRLLLNKRQMQELAKAEETKGLTIVPLKVYNKGTKLKLSLAIARGKKKYDKRETIKKRDTERELGRTLKR